MSYSTTRENYKHGKTHHPLYAVWRGMMARCYNPNEKKYPRYGGRGITVCKEWHDIDTFISDMGKRPSRQHSINRIDNDGDYCKENCCWATHTEQARNRRNNVFVTYRGITQTLAEWANETGVPYPTLADRKARGWKDAAVIEGQEDCRRHLVLFGQRLALSELEDALGVKYITVYSRAKKGWTPLECVLGKNYTEEQAHAVQDAINNWQETH